MSRDAQLRAVLVAAVVALVPAAGASSAFAQTPCTKVASPTGSDSNAGTESSPYRTAQKLADSLSAGQTGCLRAGTYESSGYVLRFGHGGSSSAPLRIQSYPDERARLLGTVYIPQGSNNVVLSGLDLEGTGYQNSIQIHSADDVIEDSNITNLRRGESCVMLGSNAGYGAATRPVLRRNFFHDCGSPAHTYKDHHIYAQNVDGGEVVDNVFVNPAAHGIQFYPNARGMRFHHNVLDQGDGIRAAIIFAGEGSLASVNNIVEYNVVTYSSQYNITYYWGSAVGSGNVARNNCTYGGAFGEINSQVGFTTTGNVTANPQFVNRSARDYRLAAGSPCLAVVGYDTAAKLQGQTTNAPPPAQEPATEPTGDTTLPSVVWSTPAAGATVSGQLNEASANCRVSAADDVGVVRVEFKLDGQALNTEAYAPWSCVWDTTKSANGTHELEATAFDAAGNATSAKRTVTVSNQTSVTPTPAPTTNLPPTVVLTSPLAGSLLSRTVSLAATATDDHGVAKVEFYADGNLVATDTTAPYSASWRASRRGIHTLVAKAYDAQGLSATSATVTVSGR